MTELDPRETAQLGPLTVTATPAKHKVPENTYILQGRGHTVYFGADTLLIPGLRAITRRFPRIDLALLAINGLRLRPLLFLGIILLHGLVIWQTPVERALALALAVLVVALSVLLLRGGAFAPRVVVELRDDRRADGQGAFAVTAVGRPLVAQVHLRGCRPRHPAPINADGSSVFKLGSTITARFRVCDAGGVSSGTRLHNSVIIR